MKTSYTFAQHVWIRGFALPNEIRKGSLALKSVTFCCFRLLMAKLPLPSLLTVQENANVTRQPDEQDVAYLD